MKFDEKIQLIIVGESSVGKTSIVNKYVSHYFTNQHLATVGLEYFTKEEKIDDKVVRVKIWDTAGQEKFKSLTRNFYKNSHGVIISYDVTNRKSFENIQTWVDSVKDNANAGIKMVLVGNKIDLTREVLTDEGKKLAELHKIPFFETSAKTNIGIQECFLKLIGDVVKDFKKDEEDGIKLNVQAQNQESGCGC